MSLSQWMTASLLHKKAPEHTEDGLHSVLATLPGACNGLPVTHVRVGLFHKGFRRGQNFHSEIVVAMLYVPVWIMMVLVM